MQGHFGALTIFALLCVHVCASRSYCTPSTLPRLTELCSYESSPLRMFHVVASAMNSYPSCPRYCDDRASTSYHDMPLSYEQWLWLNATVFESPAVIEQRSLKLIENSTFVGQYDEAVRNEVDWRRVRVLHQTFREAQHAVALEFSSYDAFLEARKAIEHTYYETHLEFEKSGRAETARHHSPLRNLMNSYFPDGLPHNAPHQLMAYGLPVFVTLAYDTQCSSCVPALQAFHRLSQMFRVVCSSNLKSVNGCPPLTIFATYPADSYFDVVPQLQILHSPLNPHRKRHKRRSQGSVQQQSETLSPFSYQLDHLSLMSDFFFFLVFHDVVQLRYVSAEEALEIEEKWKVLREKREKRRRELQMIRIEKALEAKEREAGPLGEEHRALFLREMQLAIAQDTSSPSELLAPVDKDLDEEEERTGKVQSVKEHLLVLVRRSELAQSALEQLYDDEDGTRRTQRQNESVGALLWELEFYSKWYDWPTGEGYNSTLDWLTTWVSDGFMLVWVVLLLWTALTARAQ